VTDADLLARLRSGEHDAFDALFRQWYEPVVRVAQRILRDQGIAEEITQDVFLELWRRRDGLPDGSSVPAYLMQSARNRALNHLRHLKVQQKSQLHLEALHEPSVATDTEARSTELIAAIHDAVAALPPRTREVFTLSRERNLRYVEIADLLGISVKAVEANMSRALRHLRERLARFM
jgi:RNA polymerase sigma-70 factor, ECF subfamily